MASIDKVATGWRARWRTPDGRSRSTFERKIDAQRHLTTIENSKLTGGYGDPRADKITFRTYAEQWRSVQMHRPTNRGQLEAQFAQHVYPVLGDRPLAAIRQSEVRTPVKVLDSTLAPKTVEVLFSWVRTIFKTAAADMVISRLPCQDIKRTPVTKQKVTPLPITTVEALIDAWPARSRALIVVGAGTGIRISEALGLTDDRVDWLRRTVLIDRQVARSTGDWVVFAPVKDRFNRPRTIPLPDIVQAALSEHIRVNGTGPEGFLVTNIRGGPIRQNAFSAMWRRHADPLGIAWGDGYHELRHFYASLPIRHGESVKVVQDRLGHATSAMTLDTYSHLWPEDEDRTRAAIDEALGARVSPVCHVEGSAE